MEIPRIRPYLLASAMSQLMKEGENGNMDKRGKSGQDRIATVFHSMWSLRV